MLNAKAENSGGWYQEVNSKRTSQFCSCSEVVVKILLAVRVRDSAACSLSLNRDINVTHIVLNEARMESQSAKQAVGSVSF